MLLLGADHLAAAGGGEMVLFLAIPVLWLIGVVILVAFKLRAP